MRKRVFFVYILANRTRCLYTGFTSGLPSRLRKHRNGAYLGSHTRRYNIFSLVYYETFSHAREAIAREKQLKRWPRWRKVRLIEASNPEWKDLSDEWSDSESVA